MNNFNGCFELRFDMFFDVKIAEHRSHTKNGNHTDTISLNTFTNCSIIFFFILNVMNFLISGRIHTRCNLIMLLQRIVLRRIIHATNCPATNCLATRAQRFYPIPGTGATVPVPVPVPKNWKKTVLASVLKKSLEPFFNNKVWNWWFFYI